MPDLDIEVIPALMDNYLFLIHDPETGATGIVDPADPRPVIARLEARGLTLTHILNTHHHGDHVGGNQALKARYGCTIVGPRADRDRIPGIDIEVGDGEIYRFGNHDARVFDVPGHTRGHIAYWFADQNAAFVGDTLFAMGCGRLFEGTPAQMWTSLQKLMQMPDDTRIYCAHEYTQTNGRFALEVEPQNTALRDRMIHIDVARAKGEQTIPTTMGLEKATNPFLRPASPDLQATLGLKGDDLVAVFAETRARKDSF